MGNKDEKTFLDLFSSATNELDDNSLNNEDKDINNEELNQTKEPLTFDNIFDNITSNDSKDKNIEPLSNDIAFPKKIENDVNEETKIPTDEKTNSFNFNSIFNDFTNTNIQNKENNDNVNNDTNNIEKNNNPSFDFNSIFDNIEDQDNNSEGGETSTNITINEKSTNNEEEEKKEETPLFDNNIFLTTNENNIESEKEETNDKDITLEKTNEVLSTNIEEPTPFDFSNNPFLNNDIALEEKPLVEMPAIEENPFFKEEKEELKEEESSNDNPFFDSNTIVEEPKKENNPFFDNTSNVEKTTIDNDKENKDERIEKQEETSKSTSPFFETEPQKSTSPFFDVETKNEEEINPFFQNQINLIENKTPSNQSGKIDTTNTKHFNVKVVKKKEPFYKTILGVLSYALFIWLLLIGAALLVYVLDIKIRAAKGDYSAPKFNAYVVLTGSMLPKIKVYDVVVTKKTDAAELKEGDVITFASADQRFLGTIITHRIIKKNPPTETQGYTFQTQGDNNNVADSALVPENNIFGKVILKIPKLGYLQEFLASDGGWIIVILIPCLTVISYDTVKLIKGLKKKKYKNIKVQK